jgi:hypothetical protein
MNSAPRPGRTRRRWREKQYRRNLDACRLIKTVDVRPGKPGRTLDGIASDALHRTKMNSAVQTGMYAPELEKEAVLA